MSRFFVACFIGFVAINYFCTADIYRGFESGESRKLLWGPKFPRPSNTTTSSGSEAAVLILCGVVIICVVMMVIYFIRKFEQLNKTLPSYRYSSLKTEVDEKLESECLVQVSTEEEDVDTEDDHDDDDNGPPILPVTVMPTDSDDELLQ